MLYICLESGDGKNWVFFGWKDAEAAFFPRKIFEHMDWATC
jgi:hypothetical protein